MQNIAEHNPEYVSQHTKRTHAACYHCPHAHNMCTTMCRDHKRAHTHTHTIGPSPALLRISVRKQKAGLPRPSLSIVAVSKRVEGARRRRRPEKYRPKDNAHTHTQHTHEEVLRLAAAVRTRCAPSSEGVSRTQFVSNYVTCCFAHTKFNCPLWWMWCCVRVCALRRLVPCNRVRIWDGGATRAETRRSRDERHAYGARNGRQRILCTRCPDTTRRFSSGEEGVGYLGSEFTVWVFVFLGVMFAK